MQNMQNFLDDLAEITKKYGIEICGCGCCGSPWLRDMNQNRDIADQLTYDEQLEKYEVIKNEE